MHTTALLDIGKEEYAYEKKEGGDFNLWDSLE